MNCEIGAGSGVILHLLVAHCVVGKSHALDEFVFAQITGAKGQQVGCARAGVNLYIGVVVVCQDCDLHLGKGRALISRFLEGHRDVEGGPYCLSGIVCRLA